MAERKQEVAYRPGDLLLGKYRVERNIGEGGFGVVLAARHEALEERVAIKVLLPEAAAHAGAAERFLREGRAAVRIKSEHVAKVMDVGTLESGLPYMVMEFLDGYDLSAVVKARGPQPWHEVVEWVLQASEAIAEAHSLGIVHRDLKPANLFITRKVDDSPCIKVLDFGISKIRSEGQDKGMTKTSDVMGSPYYMSPEQMRSTRDADARSDVWALGTILFELLGGVPPFDAETMTGLVVAIMQEPPRDLRALRSDLPPGLVEVVLRCLEKDPARRFQDVASLAVALAPFAGPRSRSHIERIVAFAQRAVAAPGSNAAGSARQGAPASGQLRGEVPMAGAAPPRDSGPLYDSGPMGDSGRAAQAHPGVWHGSTPPTLGAAPLGAAAAQSGATAQAPLGAGQPSPHGPSASQSWGQTQTGARGSRTPAIVGGVVATLVLGAVGGGALLLSSRVPSPKMSLTIDLPSPGALASERARPEPGSPEPADTAAPEVKPSASAAEAKAPPPSSASAEATAEPPPAAPRPAGATGARPTALASPVATGGASAKPQLSAVTASPSKPSATATTAAPKPAPDPFATPD